MNVAQLRALRRVANELNRLVGNRRTITRRAFYELRVIAREGTPQDLELVLDKHGVRVESPEEEKVSECCAAPVTEQGFCSRCREHA